MLLIPCPWCGARAQTEFAYGGDATVERPPDPEQVSRQAWLDYVYLRDNPRGPHLERWFQVRRDTLSHEVIGSAPPGKAVEEGSR